MLAIFKSLLATLCLLSTIALYRCDVRLNAAQGVASAPLYTQEITTAPSFENGSAIQESSLTRARNPMPRIIQATMMFGHNYKGLNERILQNHAEHAKRWGYENHVLTREIVGAGEVEGEGEWKKYIFSKIVYVLKFMIMELEKPREERAGWIIWYDADTLILNPNIQWEIFLPPIDNGPFSDIKILATKDVSGFNSGLFFCRVDEWVVDALTAAYAMPMLHPEVDISGNIEQHAMKWVFSQAQNKKHVVYQPSVWYNWFSSIERSDSEVKGDMMVHFSGINHDNEGHKKKATMDTWFRKLEGDPDSWHVPLEKTRYPKEISIFWGLVRQAKVILSLVRDRGDTSVIRNDHGIQLARNELRWTVEEEAYDSWKLDQTIHSMVEALRVSEDPEELALLQAYRKGEGLPGADPQAANQEAILGPKSSIDNQNRSGNPKQRFGGSFPGSEDWTREDVLKTGYHRSPPGKKMRGDMY